MGLSGLAGERVRERQRDCVIGDRVGARERESRGDLIGWNRSLVEVPGLRNTALRLKLKRIVLKNEYCQL